MSSSRTQDPGGVTAKLAPRAGLQQCCKVAASSGVLLARVCNLSSYPAASCLEIWPGLLCWELKRQRHTCSYLVHTAVYAEVATKWGTIKIWALIWTEGLAVVQPHPYVGCLPASSQHLGRVTRGI